MGPTVPLRVLLGVPQQDLNSGVMPAAHARQAGQCFAACRTTSAQRRAKPPWYRVGLSAVLDGDQLETVMLGDNQLRSDEHGRDYQNS